MHWMMIFPMMNNGHVLLQLLRFISFLYIFYTIEALIQRNVLNKRGHIYVHFIHIWLVAQRATFLVQAGFFAKNFGKFTLHEMQKINLRKARFNPCKVRLNIEKVRKREFWNFINFLKFSNVQFNVRWKR